MRRLIYSMTMSLDGFISGPDGDIGWSAPDEKLHRVHNEHVRELDLYLIGRRLYEVMLWWETDEPDASDSEAVREFAGIWRNLPKLVFSGTLERVEGNARLAGRSVEAEVARLREEPGGDIAIGGATLAGSAFGLIDELRLFVGPAVLGAGTPFFPRSAPRIDYELLESRTFGGVQYLRYGRS